MAWVKIPAANHPVFLAALPKDRRIATLKKKKAAKPKAKKATARPRR